MSDLKPCPFCGAKLEYEEHEARAIAGRPLFRSWVHPAGECFLSGIEATKCDLEAWNRRVQETDG